MKYQPLPNEHHVIRAVSWARLRKDENDKVVGIHAEAFDAIEPDGLSVTWVEHWGNDHFAAPLSAQGAIRRQREMGSKARFVCANVKAIVEATALLGQKARVIHDPEPPENTGHALVKGLSKDQAVFNLLASEIFHLS